jgi:hypothetical protein
VGGLVPSSQLPSYVDDVLEYANLAALPATGEAGKIYVALDNNKIYRWSGSVYTEVSPTVGTVWGGIGGTLSNQTDLQTALNAKQASLSGTGFVKISGTTISYDNSTYLTGITSSQVTTALGYTPVTNARTLTINGTAYDLSADRSWTIATADATKLPLSGGTLTGALTGTSATFSGALAVGGNAAPGNSHVFYNTANQTSVLIKQTTAANNAALALWNNFTTGDNSFIKFFTESTATLRGAISYDRANDRLAFNGATGGLSFTGAATFSSSVTANASTNFTDVSTSDVGNGVLITSNGVTPGAGAYGAALVFSSINGSSRRAAIVPVQGTADNDTVGLAFFTHPSGLGSNPLLEAMRIDYSGNIGIGTTSPTAYTGYATLALNGSNGGALEFQKAGIQQARISNAGAQELQFVTANAEAMRIFSNQNVAIGSTTNAGYKLDVTGSAYISNHAYASIFESISLGTASAASTGWYKIGSINDRGGGIIHLSVTGGSYSPTTYEIKYYKNWTNVGSLQLSMYGDSAYLSDARIRQDSADSIYYIEIYVAAVVSFQVYHQKLLGYNATGTAFTGTLTAGSASGTTIAQLPFRAYGLATQGITLTPYNGTSAVAFQRNVSGTIYNLGSIVNSGSDILYQGTGSVFINADSDSDSTSTAREVKLGNRGTVYMTVNSSGNVGIGTTSPSQRFHVYGLADGSKSRFELYGTAGINEVIQLVNTANYNPDRGVKMGLYVNAGTNSNQLGAEIGSAVSAATSAYLFFSTTDNGTTAERLRISSGGQLKLNTYLTATSWSGTTAGYLAFDSSGNVITVAGVAATDSTKLPLAGGTMTGVLAFSNVTGNKIDFYHITTAPGDRYGIQVQSSELRIHSGASGTATGGITFGKSTTSTFTEAMRINNAGNVLIGTTTDSGYRFDVNGTGRYSGRLTLLNTDSVDFALYHGGAASGSARIYYNQPNNQLRIYATAITSDATTGIGSLALYNGSAYKIVLTEANVGSYALPLSGGTLSGGITFTAPGGSVLLKHAVSEVDAWIFQENAANWGLYWKNAPTGHHTFGGYTTVGAELVGMSAVNASGNGVLTSNFVGATSAYAQWMISNYTGYIWSASTIFAAGDFTSPTFNSTSIVNISGSNNTPINITGAAHKYLTINPGNGYEAMVRYIGGSGSSWYVGKRTSGQLIGTESFHFYSEAAGATVGGINPSGDMIVTGSMRAPIFYDSNDTGYYGDFAGTSSLWGLAIRGDNGASSTANQIFLWGTGNTTTSAIGFKSNAGSFGNPTGSGDGYNTYFTMDTPGRGWVFRRGTGGSDFSAAYTAGWILNNGIAQFNASVRSPIFYDSDNTAYYGDFASTSRVNGVYADYIGVGQDINTSYRLITNGSIYLNSNGNGFAEGTWKQRRSGGTFYDVIDAGNIGGQNVAGLNADFLGTGTVSLSRGYSCVLRNENGSGAAVTYAPLLHMAASDTMWQLQGTYGTSGNGTLYFRHGYSGSWGTWLTMLSSANYNSYSPTLTGGGASGTWGINISGNANTVGGYYAAQTYTSTGNAAGSYLGGHYSSGGAEKPNSGTFGAGKLKLAMLSNSNLGFGGPWNDVLWLSAYTGGDVKGSHALVFDKYSSNVWVSDQTYDSATWGTGYLLLHSGNYTSYALSTGGGTTSGTITASFDNSWGFRLNRSSTSTYLGVVHATGGTNHWYVGNREDGTNTYRIYNFVTTINAFSIDVNGNCTANGDVTAYSDLRIKTNIETISNALDKVTSLRGVTYNRTDNGDTARKIGVIAQETQVVLPEVVQEQSDGMLTVAYGNMSGLFIEAFKEQQAQIEKLQAQLNDLLAKQ